MLDIDAHVRALRYLSTRGYEVVGRHARMTGKPIQVAVNPEGWSATGVDPVLHKVACDWLSLIDSFGVIPLKKQGA